jgi:hypothetical protein
MAAQRPANDVKIYVMHPPAPGREDLREHDEHGYLDLL